MSKYGFGDWFRSVLQVSKLEKLHELSGTTAENYYLHVRKFREAIESKFPDLFGQLDVFFDTVVSPIFGKIASRQILPTARTHLAVREQCLLDEERILHTEGERSFLNKFYFERRRPGMFHRDRDYGLLDGTVNIWVPLTEVFGTNSIWLGGPYESGADAIPVAMSPGECLCFDGANRWHGVVWNSSGVTRVGFDIRFYPMKRDAFDHYLAWSTPKLQPAPTLPYPPLSGQPV